MRIKRKLKRTTKQYIIVAFICILVIGSAAIITSIITIAQIREEYECMLSEAWKELNDNKRSVFIALSDIRTGEIISEDKVEEKMVYSSQPAESYITNNELGKAAMINIPKGSQIVKGMLAENLLSSALREIEYDVIHISPNIVANDYVDIRILYPNGENYIVMSKKSIKSLQTDTPLCYLWVNEEELLRMSAAIVDAARYQGSKLYLTKYIEANIQDASIITYAPNIAVLSLIEHDPNIVDRCSQLLNKEVRKALENRLAESLGIDVSAISWELDDSNIRDMPYMSDNKTNVVVDNKEAYRDEAQDKDKEANLTEVEDKDKEVDMDYDNDESNNKTNKESAIYFPELGKASESDVDNYYFATEG